MFLQRCKRGLIPFLLAFTFVLMLGGSSIASAHSTQSTTTLSPAHQKVAGLPSDSILASLALCPAGNCTDPTKLCYSTCQLPVNAPGTFLLTWQNGPIEGEGFTIHWEYGVNNNDFTAYRCILNCSSGIQLFTHSYKTVTKNKPYTIQFDARDTITSNTISMTVTDPSQTTPTLAPQNCAGVDNSLYGNAAMPIMDNGSYIGDIQQAASATCKTWWGRAHTNGNPTKLWIQKSSDQLSPNSAIGGKVVTSTQSVISTDTSTFPNFDSQPVPPAPIGSEIGVQVTIGGQTITEGLYAYTYNPTRYQQ